MKSEPNVYSIEDLRGDKITCWDGVRNYQARNFMRDQMRIGDGVLFYHSNIEPIGIAGMATIIKEGYPDYTAWDPNDRHYDPKSLAANPTWYMVDVEFVKACREVITLKKLKDIPKLQKMMVVQRGARLSVQPVILTEWRIIVCLPEWGR